MGLGQAISSGFSNYVNFHGRASRSEFWWFILFAIIMNLFCELLDVMMGANALVGPFYIMDQIVFYFPILTLEVRRLHDTGRSGWNVLWALTIVGLIPLIVFWAEPGQASDNAFGGEPHSGSPAGRVAPALQPASSLPTPAAVQPTGHGVAGVDFAALEKIAELHKSGVLTDEEFSQQKARLLGRA